MKSQWRFIPTVVLIAMVFMVIGGCGSGSGGAAKATMATVSGTVTNTNGVGLSGITVTLSGGDGSHTGTTDSSGKYTITRIQNGTYTATPAGVGYSFTPQNQTVVANGAATLVYNFAAIANPVNPVNPVVPVDPVVPTFTISGTVTANGVGLSGVTVTLSGSDGLHTGTTDSSGNYTITSIQNGTYIATPAGVGYSFTPQNQTIVVNGANATISAFTATAVPPAKVYVIAKSLGSVLRINANTLAIEKTINLGVSLLNSIVVIGDTLWYSWGDQWGYIGRYNLTTGQNETQIISFIYLGLLRAAPAQPGILYVGEQGLSPADIQKFDISVNPPVLLARTEHGPMGSNLGDFKISADGSKIWSACGAPYNIVEIRTSDMVLSGVTFATGAYPTAVDRTSVNGSEVLVGGTNSIYDTDIHVFQASDPSNSVSYETGRWSQPGNVAISANATTIYSVHTADYLGSSGELVTVSRPSGTVSRVPITMGTTFNSGIGVDYLTGRVFVATLDSVSVFDASGSAVGIIPSVAGASTILVVAP